MLTPHSADVTGTVYMYMIVRARGFAGRASVSSANAEHAPHIAHAHPRHTIMMNLRRFSRLFVSVVLAAVLRVFGISLSRVCMRN